MAATISILSPPPGSGTLPFLALLLSDQGLNFEIRDVSEIATLPTDLAHTVLIDIGVAGSPGHEPWGIAAARSIRMGNPPFGGAILLVSFEKWADLNRCFEHDLRGSLAAEFLRLPVSGIDLTKAVSIAMPPREVVMSSSRELWRDHLLASAKRLAHRRGGIVGSVRGAILVTVEDASVRMRTRQITLFRETWPSSAQSLFSWSHECGLVLRQATERLEIVSPCKIDEIESLIVKAGEQLSLVASLLDQGCEDRAALKVHAVPALTALDAALVASESIDLLAKQLL